MKNLAAQLVVGIAGGIHRSVSLGDVIVSSQIWGYEHGHLGKRYDSGGELFFQPDPVLLSAARNTGMSMRNTPTTYSNAPHRC